MRAESIKRHQFSVLENDDEVGTHTAPWWCVLLITWSQVSSNQAGWVPWPEPWPEPLHSKWQIWLATLMCTAFVDKDKNMHTYMYMYLYMYRYALRITGLLNLASDKQVQCSPGQHCWRLHQEWLAPCLVVPWLSCGFGLAERRLHTTQLCDWPDCFVSTNNVISPVEREVDVNKGPVWRRWQCSDQMRSFTKRWFDGSTCMMEWRVLNESLAFSWLPPTCTVQSLIHQ